MFNYSKDQIDGGIVAVAKAAGTLQDKIHALGFAILREWRVKGASADTAEWAAERLSSLQGASPYHSDAFSKWVAKYAGGRLVLNPETGAWVAHAKDFAFIGKAAKEVLKLAKAEPFYKLKPASKPKPYDDLEAFIKFFDALEAKNKKAATDDNITVHPAFINKARELAKLAGELAAA